MPLKYLQKYKDEVSHCVRCGACQSTCPTYSVAGDESMVARGRMALVDAVIDGRLDITKGFAKRINSCLDCKRCIVACPSDVKVDEIIYAAKAEIAESFGCNPLMKFFSKGLVLRGWPFAYFLRFFGILKRIFYDPLPDSFPLPLALKVNGIKRSFPDVGGKPLRNIYKGVQSVDEPKGRVAFFVGCATNSIYQNIGEATIEVLQHNGIEVVMVEDELCCGIPFLSNGDRETASSLARKNIERFTSLDVDAVITSCATCGSTLKHYDSWVDDENAKKLSPLVMDIHKYLAEYTDYTKGLGTVNKKVTWHDPCHLSRGQDVKDEPREILRAIPGLEFVEMRKPCDCCGFGGEVSFNDYEMSMAIAKGKVEAIKDSGASGVATGCPACKTHIDDALHHFNVKSEIHHTVEYLAQSYRAGRK
ncbi:MAG: (Fe-S)-binding protein [Proteobacteria bacterium]|nr:(Fe-S)-binding protein [Pseudomonadota bacterium]